MILQIALAFLEGLGVILSPCCLPMLPLVLSSSVDSSKTRAIGVILGFILAFSLFMFCAHTLVLQFHISTLLIRKASLVLLGVFGVKLLWARAPLPGRLLANNISNLGYKWSNNPHKGLLGGMLFGSLLGLIWTPCAGPIFGAVMAQVMTQSSLQGLLSLLAFSTGVGIPMLGIVLLEDVIMDKMAIIHNHLDKVHKVLGLIILGTVAYLW